jgi:hypothetical protein
MTKEVYIKTGIRTIPPGTIIRDDECPDKQEKEIILRGIYKRSKTF